MELPTGTAIKKQKKLTSVVWNHFERVKKADICYAVCVHCNKRLSGSSNSGTTHLRNHLVRCLKRSNCDVSQLLAKRRKKDNAVTLANYSFGDGEQRDERIPVATIKFEQETKREDVVAIGRSAKFDQERSQLDLARMIILHGYPLSMVEHTGFKMFVKNLQPLFDITSNSVIELDCISIYEKEKQKMYGLINRLHGRISVSIEVWSSAESARYLCLKAHYIDEEWNLQKKVLNFVMIDAAHTEDIHSEVIIKCLMDWGTERRVFSMTFSDLFTGDDIVYRIKDHLSQNRPLLSNGRLFDVRCSSNLLSLLVEDAMDALREVARKIRDVIHYVKGSQMMQGKFNEISQQVGVDMSKSLFLDSPSRWNSTCTMLEMALPFRAVFSVLLEKDPSYQVHLSQEEWQWASSVTGYLKLFVEITNNFTGKRNPPTANIFFPDICDVHVQLIDWCKSSDGFISSMALRMKEKFDIYWKKCCLSLAIAAILDPRFKMKLVEYYYPQIYGSTAQEEIKYVSDAVRELFEEYSIGSASTTLDPGCGSSKGGNIEPRDRLKGFDKFLHDASQSHNLMSDLDKYLEEPIFPRNHDFNILTWWKVHTPRFPILSLMAQDVLGITMSTMSEELAFRTGGRVLDQYQSSLNSDTVQALVCTQDWLRAELEEPTLSQTALPLPIEVS